MAATFPEYFRLLEKLGDVMDKLSAIAKEKTIAVKRDDVLAVDDCMKREQALSLSLRSTDIKREKMLAELGLQGVPLSGLVSHTPPELRDQAQQAAERLRRQYDLYLVASQTARNALETSLHQIDKFLAERDVSPELGGDGHARSVTDFRA